MDSKSNIAISVKNVSKTFRIPHEKVSSLRGAAVNAFSRNKGYEEFKALNDVSFEVKKGEFFGIIGRNGSGKSTLLKILAGIYQADKGRVHVNGMISPFLELGIGFNPELSGRDNVYLNATVLGLSKKEIDEKFDSIVKFSELERFIDQKLKNYSSGMQVRLAFSVSIHANREILLMDEVLAVGDNNFQNKCIREFTRYREMGKTVILVTHDIETVRRYCDRAMLIRYGVIKKIGNAEDVAEEYIFENMGDEEKRAKSNKKESSLKKDNGRWGSGDVIFTSIELMDENGVQRSTFKSFDDVKLRLYYKKNNDIENVIFGIELFNDANYRLAGFNTYMINETLSLSGKTGYIEFEFKKMPLLKGKYFITPAMASSDCGKQYDYWKNAIEFTIMNDGKQAKYLGDLNIKMKINGKEF